MKSIKHFSMFLFAGMCSLLMASCLSDDDNDESRKKSVLPIILKSVAVTWVRLSI